MRFPLFYKGLPSFLPSFSRNFLYSRFPIHLSPGDCVLLVSDGVTGTEDDSWLRERLVKFDQGSPKELARDLITHSPQGATDDSTALVIRLEKRE